MPDDADNTAANVGGGPATFVAMRTLTDDEVATHVDRIAAEGWTVVEDAIEPDLVDDLTAALDQLERDLDVTPADNSFEGRRTMRIYNLLVHGEVFERVPVHSNVLPIVERVLDPGCLLSSLSSIAIGPDESPQPIHADDQLVPIPKPHPPVVCNTMWALTDFSEANGATRLVPRTHFGESPDFGHEYDSIAAEMARGSVLVWHGSLWHGGGANTTTHRRIGLACNYCAGYIRQQENQQLGIPRGVAQRFDERLQRLCGYGIYNGLIGHIDKRDPVELLRDDCGGSMVWDAL
jgi:ectoine hydroxylase-related dioxygenase (phytanoyl-CoA dioxygenase family)